MWFRTHSRPSASKHLGGLIRRPSGIAGLEQTVDKSVLGISTLRGVSAGLCQRHEQMSRAGLNVLA
jgi:hypothetical protein